MHPVRVFVSVALVLLSGASAFAQAPRESRPYRGLFGSTKSATEQVLSVSFNAGGGYDDDVLLGDSFGIPPPSAGSPSSTIGQFSGALSYTLSRTGTSFFASTSVGTSHYASLAQPWVTSGGASTGGSFQLSSHTTFSASAGLTRQSMYYFAPLVGLPPDPVAAPIIDPVAAAGDPFTTELPVQTVSTDPVLGLRNGQYTMLGVSAGLGYALTRRLNTAVHYSYQDSQQPTLEDFKQQSAGAGLSYLLSKSLAARLGYSLSQTRYAPEDGIQRLHQIDAGIDFNRALSLTRRTTLEVHTGTAALVDEDRTHFHVTGNASLTRELGRTWSASVVYNRDVSFLQTFHEPVFSDALSTGVGGLFNRHLQFQSSFGSTFGTVGIGSINNGFTNYFATAALRVGFTRNLGLSLTYSFYRYHYEDGVDLPGGVPSKTDRQSIRATVNFWSVLFQRARRSNASR